MTSLFVCQKDTPPQWPAAAHAAQRPTLARVNTKLFAEFVVVFNGVAIESKPWSRRPWAGEPEARCLALAGR